MVTSLIRGKQFNRGHLLRKYWRIVLDGTGLFYFKEKHCENCLCTTRKNENGSGFYANHVEEVAGKTEVEKPLSTDTDFGYLNLFLTAVAGSIILTVYSVMW